MAVKLKVALDVKAAAPNLAFDDQRALRPAQVRGSEGVGQRGAYKWAKWGVVDGRKLCGTLLERAMPFTLNATGTFKLAADTSGI